MQELPEGFRSIFVDCGEARLHVVTNGATGADGKLDDPRQPVVFLHGSGPGASGASNFRGNVELTENVALTLEAENLLDKSYRAMDQIEGAGRNLSIFLTATF